MTPEMYERALDKYKLICIGGPKHGYRLRDDEVDSVKRDTNFSREIAFAISIPIDIWKEPPYAGGTFEHAQYRLEYMVTNQGALPVPFMAYTRMRQDEAYARFTEFLLFPLEK